MDPQVECSSVKAENQSRKRALIGIGVVLLLVPLALAGRLAWNSRDIPAPDVSDLTLQPRQLPAEQDAYTHFERAAAALVWPKDAAFLRLDAAPQPDDEARVSELVVTNGEALRHLKSGLACEACLGPQDWRYDATVPVIRWQNLGRLLAAQTRCELRAGHRTQAVAACADSLRFSDFLTRDASCAVVWLIGTSSARRAARPLRWQPVPLCAGEATGVCGGNGSQGFRWHANPAAQAGRKKIQG